MSIRNDKLKGRWDYRVGDFYGEVALDTTGLMQDTYPITILDTATGERVYSENNETAYGYAMSKMRHLVEMMNAERNRE